MNKYQIQMENKINQSPSLKKLVDLQTAYTHASQRLQKSNDHADTLIYNAVRYAIQTYSINLAQKLEADNSLITTLQQSDSSINWHEILYIFINRIPKLEEYFAS
jgi:hypothetical protein